MTDEAHKGSKGNDVHVDIGNISAAGHVVITGGDATVQGSTRGDGNESLSLTVGGVETNERELAQLKKALSKIDKTIQTSNLEPEAVSAAKHNAESLKQQLTSPNKPNEHLLVQAAEALFTFGPDISGAVVGAFTTPLVGKIVSHMSERTLKFYRHLREMKTGNLNE